MTLDCSQHCSHPGFGPGLPGLPWMILGMIHTQLENTQIILTLPPRTRTPWTEEPTEISPIVIKPYDKLCIPRLGIRDQQTHKFVSGT